MIPMVLGCCSRGSTALPSLHIGFAVRPTCDAGADGSPRPSTCATPSMLLFCPRCIEKLPVLSAVHRCPPMLACSRCLIATNCEPSSSDRRICDASRCRHMVKYLRNSSVSSDDDSCTRRFM